MKTKYIRQANLPRGAYNKDLSDVLIEYKKESLESNALATCAICKKPIFNRKVLDYSVEYYKKPMCFVCQKKYEHEIK